ncbi:MAG: hypothetical protein ACOCRX_08395 [Candidatus Woesearchaeota archaeon]
MIYKMVEIRDFKSDEISSINYYVSNQIPHTVLPQLFTLTEERDKKIKVYLTIYRILNTVAEYIGNKETKKKINDLLKESENIFKKLLRIQIEQDSDSLTGIESFGYENETNEILVENYNKINKLISCFMVFAERQELIETEKVTGINYGSEEGKKLKDKLKDNFG